MMRRSGIAAVLFGKLAMCSHAISAKLASSHFAEGNDGLDWTDGEEPDFDDLAGLDWKEADEDAIAKAMLQSNQYVIVDLDSAGAMKLVTTRVMSSLLEDEGTGEGWDGKTVTFSPKARARLHAAKFEKEFTVTIDMAHAHDTGMSLGAELSFDTDYQPAQFEKVRKKGLIEEWNRAHPGEDVHVGDEIVQVNDIQWHANTQNFVKRIAGQFKSGRKEMAGAKDALTLYIQRPHQQSHKRFALQREDAHHKAYPVEFVTEVPLPTVVDVTSSMNDVMGWKLAAKQDWEPISIGNISQVGSLATYNKMCSPERVILPGDEIVKVNNISWHHSASLFDSRIQQQFQASFNAARGLVLSIRRPRKVQEDWEAEHHATSAAGEKEGVVGAAEDEVVGAAEDGDDEVVGAAEDEEEMKPAPAKEEAKPAVEAETQPAPEEETKPAPEAEKAASSGGEAPAKEEAKPAPEAEVLASEEKVNRIKEEARDLRTLADNELQVTPARVVVQPGEGLPSSGARLEEARVVARRAADGVAASEAALAAASSALEAAKAWAKRVQEALRVEEAAAQQAGATEESGGGAVIGAV